MSYPEGYTDKEHDAALGRLRGDVVENTAKTAEEHPEIFLVEAMMTGASNSIERQESRGQQQLVCGDVIPTDRRIDDSVLIELGFTLGEVVQDDPIFQRAGLPDGWSKKATDHAMWSHIIDERGRKRFGVFYKAAFYDRSAHMSMSNRYYVGRDYDAPDGVLRIHAVDCEVVLNHTVVPSPPVDEQFRAEDEMVAEMKEWMNQNYWSGWDDTVLGWNVEARG